MGHFCRFPKSTRGTELQKPGVEGRANFLPKPILPILLVGKKQGVEVPTPNNSQGVEVPPPFFQPILEIRKRDRLFFRIFSGIKADALHGIRRWKWTEQLAAGCPKQDWTRIVEA